MAPNTSFTLSIVLVLWKDSKKRTSKEASQHFTAMLKYSLGRIAPQTGVGLSILSVSAYGQGSFTKHLFPLGIYIQWWKLTSFFPSFSIPFFGSLCQCRALLCVLTHDWSVKGQTGGVRGDKRLSEPKSATLPWALNALGLAGRQYYVKEEPSASQSCQDHFGPSGRW